LGGLLAVAPLSWAEAWRQLKEETMYSGIYRALFAMNAVLALVLVLAEPMSKAWN
jgi:hypothetical protein